MGWRRRHLGRRGSWHSSYSFSGHPKPSLPLSNIPWGPIPGQQFLFLISVLTMPNFSSSPDFSSLRKWVTASVGFYNGYSAPSSTLSPLEPRRSGSLVYILNLQPGIRPHLETTEQRLHSRTSWTLKDSSMPPISKDRQLPACAIFFFLSQKESVLHLGNTFQNLRV